MEVIILIIVSLIFVIITFKDGYSLNIVNNKLDDLGEFLMNSQDHIFEYIKEMRKEMGSISVFLNSINASITEIAADQATMSESLNTIAATLQVIANGDVLTAEDKVNLETAAQQLADNATALDGLNTRMQELVTPPVQ